MSTGSHVSAGQATFFVAQSPIIIKQLTSTIVFDIPTVHFLIVIYIKEHCQTRSLYGFFDFRMRRSSMVQVKFQKYVYFITFTLLLSIGTAQATGETPLIEPQRLKKPTPRVSLCTRLSNELKRNWGWYTKMLALGGATAGVFYHQYSEERAKGTVEHAISGGCTAAIEKVIIPAVLVPTARVLMSQLQNTRVGCWLGSHRRIDAHKAFATVFSLAAATHTVLSILKNPNFLHTREGKTGVVMWSAILGPLVGSYLLKDSPCLSRCSYNNKFLHPHQLGLILFGVGYGLHNPELKLVPWIAIPVGGLALDRLIEFGFYTHNSDITAAKIDGDQMTMTVRRPLKMNVEPGQFVYLKINGRYHPLTIAWSDENELSFVLGQAGPGTKDLYNLIKQDQFPSQVTTSIRGPFNSPFQRIGNGSSTIAVSTGSGVSVSTSKLDQLAKTGHEEKITIIHSERNPESFFPLIDAIDRAKKKGIAIQPVHLFLTAPVSDIESGNGNNDTLGSLRRRTNDLGMDLIEDQPHSYQGRDRSDNPNLNQNGRHPVQLLLHRGRLNPERLSSDNELGLNLLQDPHAHVLISGNPQVVEMVEDFSIKNGLNYTKEAFQF